MKTLYPSQNKLYKKLSENVEPLLQANEIALVYKRTPTNVFVTRSHCAFEAFEPYFEQVVDLQEIFVCATLSRKNELLGIYKVSSGSTVGTIVDISKICAKVILTNASSVIVAHNHPSGNNKPSQEDKVLTTKLKEALKLFSVNLLDHLIIYNSKEQMSYFSMAEDGLM